MDCGVPWRVLLLHVHRSECTVDDVDTGGSRYQSKGHDAGNRDHAKPAGPSGDGRAAEHAASRCDGNTTMKMRFALMIIATLSLFSIAVAHAQSDVSVRITPPGTPVAAGRQAILTVITTGADPSGLNLEYRVDGGQISGVLSLNETAPRIAQASVHVTRETPGDATLIASRAGVEVARATVTFVQGAPLALALHLDAPANAAARTFYFEVLDANGGLVDVVRMGTSGDAPRGAASTLPLPLADYLVRPALGHDVAASCGGRVFYAITPAAGVQIALGTDWLASFDVRPCAVLPAGIGVDAPYDPYTPAPGIVDEVAGARTGAAPLPPATGSGQAEKPEPRLPDGHAHQLFGMFVVVVGLFAAGTLAAQFLAQVAPVQKPEKKR